MKKTFFVFLLWICAAAAFSEESVRTEFDNVVFRAADCVTVGQSEVRPAEKGMSLWRFAVNRGRSQLFGIDFKGKAPLPKRIMFSVESKVRLPLIVGVADSKGNRAFCRDYMIVSGNGRDNFNISFDDFIPFALGAPAVEDVSSVFIGSCTTVEDFVRTPGFKDMYISDVTLRFPYGKAIPQKYTRSQIETHARRVEAKRDALKSLLDRIKSKGFSCRYETASYTVVNQFIGYARKEAEEGKTDRAHNQLEYIESLSEETLASLEAIDKDPSKHIEYKVPNMSDISVKDGVCYSGGRPVFLVGVMGWCGPEDCETIYNTGFDYVSFEFPLSEDFDPGKFAEKKTLLDSVAKNNLALSVLLAPHYVDDVAREKYPNIDPTGLRSRNLFTPWCIESDDFRAMVKDHVDYIVPKIRGYKNLVGYDLANELMYPVLPDFDYKRFTESGFDYPDPWTAQAEYSKEVMYRFMEYYVGCVKTWDDTRPIFFKILSPKPEAMGFDSERVSDIVTGHGLDAFITPNDRDYGLAIDNVYESLALDKYRSKDPNKTITDGEYHLIDYTEERLKCSAEFVNAALWSGFVRGKDMSAIWLWDRDVENEWGMFYCQPWAVHAAGKAVMDANRIADKVVPFAKQKGDFAIVSDGAGLNDLYVACDFCDVNFDVVTDKMIRERPLDYRFIVACEDAALSEESLKKAEAAGVKIIRVKYGTDPKKINKTLKRYLKTAPKVKIDKWGAECRSYTDGSDTYFYVINHNKEPIDVTLPKEAENLLTGERVKDFRLESLGVRIMKL